MILADNLVDKIDEYWLYLIFWYFNWLIMIVFDNLVDK